MANKGQYGRPSSYGRDISGFRGWVPVKFYEGRNPDGSAKMSEGFKNVLNNQEVRPAEGFNGEPPYPTGELAAMRSPSDAYREGWERIWGKKSGPEV